MAMTREQVLADMEADFEKMTDAERNRVLFNEYGTDWTPALLVKEVRDNTEYGQKYVQAWSASRDQDAQLKALLDMLLGPEAPCDDPNCEVHGSAAQTKH